MISNRATNVLQAFTTKSTPEIEITLFGFIFLRSFPSFVHGFFLVAIGYSFNVFGTRRIFNNFCSFYFYFFTFSTDRYHIPNCVCSWTEIVFQPFLGARIPNGWSECEREKSFLIHWADGYLEKSCVLKKVGARARNLSFARKSSIPFVHDLSTLLVTFFVFQQFFSFAI